jgi:hypothetical protein
MKQPKSSGVKFFFTALILLLLILAGAVYWLYSGELTPQKTNIFLKLPLPVALTGNHPIPMKNFILRYNLAEQLSLSQPNGLSDGQIKQQAYNRLITDAETAQIAAKNNIFISQAQINADYASRAQAADLGSYKNFEDLLFSYGLDENDFKNQVIKPVLLSVALQTWFNSQNKFNPQEYALANSLVQRIQQGEDFSALAGQYSQDQTGQSLGGDLGFVQVKNLLKELQETVDAMPPGGVKIIASRFGLHIVRLEQKIGSAVHLSQIFINTQGYNQWLIGQQQNIKVWQLFKI